VNVLVAGFNHELSVAQLEDLGVRRISVGSALATATWTAFIAAAEKIAEAGSFDGIANGTPSAKLYEAFSARS
jgi:2-methylisocitrate lyase-like PEP mutase family enzyme